MSAKKKSPSNKPASVPTSIAPATAVAAPASEPAPAWINSTDPKRRTWGKIVLVALWIYVLALWVLALDQTFDWGLFGPKVPPTP